MEVNMETFKVIFKRAMVPVKRGIKKGITTTVTMSKVIIPVYLLVTFLKYTPFMNYITFVFKPIMNLVGLPGEAALSYVMGNMINLYAGIAAMSAITLTTKQITIIAVMLSFSHTLFLETAICKKAGASGIKVILFRQALALISGIILNIIL